MRTALRRLLCTAVVVVMATPALAHAAPKNRFGLENPSAIRHAESAAKAAERDDYETAIRELKTAYSIEPTPNLLYAWAQSERLGGHCNRAIKLYDDFLQTSPPEQLANQARVNLLDCRAETGQTVPAAPGPDDDDDDDGGDDTDDDADDGAGETDDTDDETDDGPPTLREEYAAPILLGLGAAAAIAGGITLGIGRERVASSGRSTTEQQYYGEIDGGRSMYFAGAAVMGVGGVLIVAGAIRYVVVAKRIKNENAATARTLPSASAMVGPHGFGLNFSGRF